MIYREREKGREGAIHVAETAGYSRHLGEVGRAQRIDETRERASGRGTEPQGGGDTRDIAIKMFDPRGVWFPVTVVAALLLLRLHPGSSTASGRPRA